MERRSSPAVDLTSNAMTPIHVLIMDFGAEHFLAEQLVRILSSSVQPAFAITRAREEDCDIASANGSLSAKMDGDAAALLFFAFEHFPTDQIVASLLETSRRTGNGSVSIVVIQEGSPRQLAHLFDLGATDVWQVPLRAAEILGRLAHWVNPVAPPEHHHAAQILDRKSTRLNSSHGSISYAGFFLKKQNIDHAELLDHLRCEGDFVGLPVAARL